MTHYDPLTQSPVSQWGGYPPSLLLPRRQKVWPGFHHQWTQPAEPCSPSMGEGPLYAPEQWNRPLIPMPTRIWECSFLSLSNSGLFAKQHHNTNPLLRASHDLSLAL